MSRLPEFALSIVLAVLLTACGASTGTPRSNVDADSRDAAALQVKLGRGYMEQGDLETAMDKLQRALQIDPRSVDAHTMLAVLNDRIRRPVQAESFYRKAVQLAPDNGEVNNNLGAFLCGTGKYQEADAYFLKAVDDPFYRSPAAALSNAGVCALKANDSVKAERYFRQVLNNQPTNATALYEMARLSHARQDDLRARAFLQRLEASSPPDPVALELGRSIETRLGDAAAARRYATRLKDEFPDYEPDAHTHESSPP